MTIALILAAAKSFLFVLATMLPILNPAATAPIFLSMTDGASLATRIVLARRIARNMFWLMAGSMLVGSYVLDFFGISLPIVRVGGGLLLASVAWRLLGANPATPDSRAALAEAFTPDHAHRQSFYPLTFPISCGPASISVAITVGVALHDVQLVFSLARMGGALLALALIGVLLYLAFRYGQHFLRLIGDAGTAVFLRLTAFILLCLGVQIVWDGLRELVLEMVPLATGSGAMQASLLFHHAALARV
ncbi:NAAT family transporter [Massilia sp. PAMC28688]|uniref:MarC family protein n=1 Tax=Massilia sp. PAMC28688 TaxID=2861283 RepID=UPI001C6366FE|nr:MarC family protein [Massilia sp. PAMC28688]QYF94655.1 NAAT family transporter [Massilia sp. PAMC28688]